jgi:hypothetical protein
MELAVGLQWFEGQSVVTIAWGQWEWGVLGDPSDCRDAARDVVACQT